MVRAGEPVRDSDAAERLAREEKRPDLDERERRIRWFSSPRSKPGGPWPETPEPKTYSRSATTPAQPIRSRPLTPAGTP
jgi:hypothetical protein